MLDLTYIGETDIHKVEYSRINSHVISIKGCLPARTNGFVLSRENMADAWDYKDYTTVYRQTDEEILFSNDGSRYRKPLPKVYFAVTDGGILEGQTVQETYTYEELCVPEVKTEENYRFVGWEPEIPDSGEIEGNITYTAKVQYIPTLEELKTEKKAEIASACESIIHAGVDVGINGQTEHFSLTTNDQLNLFGKQAQILEGETQFEYHQDGSPCRYYSLEEMQKIIRASMEHVSYHTTYCNSLNMWIAGAETKEEAESIFYGADIPEKYQSEVLQTYLCNIKNSAEV